MTIQFLNFESTTHASPIEATVEGKATVKIGSEVRQLKAYDDGTNITFHGLAVKYLTGKKIWWGQATVSKENSQVIHIRGGLDIHRRNGITEVVGFYEDYPVLHRSTR